ncbi:MAG: hypothetical protein AB8U69_02040 [Anaplasma ovis]|uniref:hypothetical protein n=1 Tax=Anaplasma ovis TaxID=142058 RepID=UPI001F1ACA51|nr:hypothetical protein [Anaplasma ovis]
MAGKLLSPIKLLGTLELRDALVAGAGASLPTVVLASLTRGPPPGVCPHAVPSTTASKSGRAVAREPGSSAKMSTPLKKNALQLMPIPT